MHIFFSCKIYIYVIIAQPLCFLNTSFRKPFFFTKPHGYAIIY